MPGSRDVRAGGAYVEILTKDAALRKGLDNASKTLAKWAGGIDALGKTFLKIGAAAVAPLAATTKVFASMGDTLAKASTRTGVGVEALSELKYAAEQSGAGFEDLETGIRKMQKTLVEAAKGGGPAAQSLALLGLTIKDLKGLSPEDQFAAIAEQLSKVKDPAVKAALAMEVFGKGGTTLLPLMADGARGIEALRKRAAALGLTMKTDDAEAAVKFGDTLDDLWKVVKQGTFNIGAFIGRAMQPFAERLVGVLVNVNRWVSAHQAVILTALKLTASVLAAGAALYVMGKALAVAGLVAGGISSALGVVGSVARGVATTFGLFGSAVSGGLVVLRAILSPIGLAAAGFALVAVAIGTAVVKTAAWASIVRGAVNGALALKDGVAAVWRKVLEGLPVIGEIGAAFGEVGAFIVDTFQQAGAFLARVFTDIFNTAKTAVQGISDAFSAGDIRLGVEILWVGIKTAFEQGVAALKVIWVNFKKDFLEAAYGAFYGGQAAWEITQHWLTNAWIDLAATGKKIWAELAAGFASVWESTINATEKGIHQLKHFLGQTTDAELAAALALADQQSELNKRQIEDDRKAARAKAKADQDAAHAIEQKQNDQNMAGIGKGFNDKKKEIEDAAAASLGGDNAKLAALKNELNNLRNEAGNKAKNAAVDSAVDQVIGIATLGVGGDNQTSVIEALKQKWREVASGLDQVNRQTSVAGTFNSAAVGFLGGSSIAEQQLETQKKIERNTRNQGPIGRFS